MVSFDDVLAFVRVLGSSVEGDDSFVLLNVAGTSGIDLDTLEETDQDEQGEQGTQQELYSALGRVARPLPPTDDGRAEGLAARAGDDLITFGIRDPRIHQKFPNPAAGTIADVHYGGGFHSMDLNDNGETVHTIYAPNADASEAQAIIVDPDQGISLVEKSGYLIFLSEDGILLQAKSGGLGGLGTTDTAVIIRQGQITISAPSIALQGNVVVGASAITAVPLSPSSVGPSLYVSTI